jgi:hypothetical protein
MSGLCSARAERWVQQEPTGRYSGFIPLTARECQFILLNGRWRAQKEVPLPVEAWKRDSGSDGRRSRDLSIFSRTLYQLSYRALRNFLNRRHGHAGESRPCLATLTGLEPATSAVTGRRANQLRYRA